MKPVEILRKNLAKRYQHQFELDIGEGDFVLLTIISNEFQSYSRSQRLEQVEALIRDAGLIPGIIELYTSQEANEEGIELHAGGYERVPASWQDAVDMLSSGKKNAPKKYPHKIKRVVFYSYKGGVGRTTALIHTAFQLIRAGKRVAVVDMDVEAPALQTLLPPNDEHLNEGLIDYLWERQTCLHEDIKLSGNDQGRRTGIVYPYKKDHNLFVVPAGKISQRYIKRLASLSVSQFFSKDDVWEQFEKDLWEQFQPDIILVDARTGLNEWGGLSLLRIADEVFIVLYPNKQNTEGVVFIKNMLKITNGINANIILSPVPEGIIGARMVENVKPDLGFSSKDEEEIDLIQIPYHPSVAGAEEFPVETALPYYAAIANKLLEISGVKETENIIAKSNRLELIDSLSFPERDAASILDQDFDAIFQKTDDFDRCLDDAVWVIRGRKGTGKSTLYRLFTQHRENAEKRSHGRLENINIVSAHGNSDTFRPTSDIFADMQKKIKAGGDWLSLWRIYAIIRIYRSCPEFSEEMKNIKSNKLFLVLQNYFSNKEKYWNSKHTDKLSEMAIDSEINGYCRDAFKYFNEFLLRHNKKIWLFYDDMDQDIREGTEWQQDALGGLMRLVYDTNNQDLFQIRFKIFLREDIWSNLVFTNKSHFGDARTLLLKWNKNDFLRLAYRLVVSSKKVENVLNRIHPVSESNLDQADEETLRLILSPIWGLKQKGKNAYIAQWVYNRMTDSSNNTYPRSLTILLKKAREVELKSQQGKNAPADRLLRWNAMTEGLAEASKERCDAIKNEYQELNDFFNHIGELSSLFKLNELEDIWKKTSLAQSGSSFDSFLKKIESIGLISKKKYNEKYDYAVASLYIDGFGVQRKQGQRK